MRLLLTVLLFGLLANSAHAFRDALPPVNDNPADELLDVPLEDSRYNHAVRCTKRTKPGVAALADKLFRRLLAPDAAGKPQALARRMGVQELIWDCGYWGAGMTSFQPYGPCYTKRGKPRRNVNVTIAHRDHIHIAMTKPGAKAKPSFWTAG
jgi:hypothetical protein